MFISYQDDHLRECCLLLRPASLNSSFTTIEIKAIRAFIADLKSAPKLSDAPLNYSRNSELGVVEISDRSIKVICQIISSLDSPRDHQIERLKVLEILNIDLQLDLKQKHNLK